MTTVLFLLAAVAFAVAGAWLDHQWDRTRLDPWERLARRDRVADRGRLVSLNRKPYDWTNEL